jgi:hypothetical protein
MFNRLFPVFCLIALWPIAANAESIPKAPQPSKPDKRIKLINKSSQKIVGFYASPTSQTKWDYNMLRGGRVIKPRETVTADVDEGTKTCLYDLLIKTAKGDEVRRFKLNVCTTAYWTITD